MAISAVQVSVGVAWKVGFICDSLESFGIAGQQAKERYYIFGAKSLKNESRAVGSGGEWMQRFGETWRSWRILGLSLLRFKSQCWRLNLSNRWNQQWNIWRTER